MRISVRSKITLLIFSPRRTCATRECLQSRTRAIYFNRSRKRNLRVRVLKIKKKKRHRRYLKLSSGKYAVIRCFTIARAIHFFFFIPMCAIARTRTSYLLHEKCQNRQIYLHCVTVSSDESSTTSRSFFIYFLRSLCKLKECLYL